MKNKKKIIVLAAMVILLVASAFLNVWLNNKLNQQTPVGETDEVAAAFSSYRTYRETGRQEILSYLNAIIEAESTSAEAKAAAEAQRQSINDDMLLELTLESLIKARGFTHVLVTLSEENATVTVGKTGLQADEVAQIKYVVTSETDYKAGDVIVLEY